MIKEEIIDEFSEIFRETGIISISPEQENTILGKKIKDNKPLRTILPSQKIITKQNKFMNNTNIFNTSTINNNRGWKILQTSIPSKEITETLTKIEIKTRSDQPSLDIMPERLYSSLKYEVTQEINSSVYNSAVLMCKIEVVNPFDSDEIITKQGGKPVLKGTTELIPLTMNSKKTFLYSKTKLQFLSVSFHHENKYFAFKFSYYNPENLNQPILIQLSAPFQVFARRPRRKISKKRGRKEEGNEESVSEDSSSEITEKQERINSKKMKKEVTAETSNTINSTQTIILSQNKQKTQLDEFLTCLEVLMNVKEQLNKDEQKIADEHIQNHLLAFTERDNYKNIMIKEEFDSFHQDIENYTNFEEMSDNLDFGNNYFN
jgi:hypothetical protein